jgi:amidase
MPLSRRAFGQTLALGAVTATSRETGHAAAAAASAPKGEPARPPSVGGSPQTAGGPIGGDGLCDLDAIDLVARLRRREVSAVEVMRAHLSRIERVNPGVNAIVTLVAARALAEAARADEALARNEGLGPLHGLPVAHKDLVDTAGIRTTRGSLFYKDHVPDRDAGIVTRMRAAGAITIGKTNTPEFGAGSHTFNDVFGPTRNPWDRTRSCGGSSGGSAVALACGMVPLADGSDTGGSLRNPAAWCNVVGFRPSPGRVPRPGGWSPLSVTGPMGRTVSDVALLLSVVAGADAADPLALQDDSARFRGSLDREMKDARIAWWSGLGGLPFETEVREIVDGTRRVFEDLGCHTETAEPDFAGVDQAFPALRYLANYAQYKPLVERRPEWVKDTIKYEVAQVEGMTGPAIARAMACQTRMYHTTREFFTRYEFFVLPVTQVSPFDVKTPFPTQINDTPMPSYIDWMRSCWYVTFMGCPAISVPAGFTKAGLPVGLQIVGRHRADLGVLQLARAFEQATGYGRRRPPHG